MNLFKMCNYKIRLVQFLLLVKSVTYAIPVNSEDLEFQSTTPTIEPENLNANISDSLPNENEIPVGQNDGDQRVDLSDMFKDVDVKVYTERSEDGNFKTLCWAELLILTENNKNNNMTLSREFSIILESPADILEENLIDKEIESYELIDGNTKKSKTMNFTTVSKTEEFTVREHKTLLCGAGPIVTKEYTEWPKSNRTKLEIRLTPTTPTAWRVCRKNILMPNPYENKSTTSCNTFDTTETNEVLTATEKITTSTQRPRKSKKGNKKRNEVKIKSTKSITFTAKSKDTSHILKKFADMSHDLEYNTNSKGKENSKLYPENLESSEEVLQQAEVDSGVELLRRNMYFKKFDGVQQNLNDSITAGSNFNPLDNAILFDLIFPDKKVLTSLYNPEVKHKFLIKIKIEIEHRIPNGANGPERTDLLIGMEEDSVYHTLPNYMT